MASVKKSLDNEQEQSDKSILSLSDLEKFSDSFDNNEVLEKKISFGGFPDQQKLDVIKSDKNLKNESQIDTINEELENNSINDNLSSKKSDQNQSKDQDNDTCDFNFDKKSNECKEEILNNASNLSNPKQLMEDINLIYKSNQPKNDSENANRISFDQKNFASTLPNIQINNIEVKLSNEELVEKNPSLNFSPQFDFDKNLPENFNINDI